MINEKQYFIFQDKILKDGCTYSYSTEKLSGMSDHARKTIEKLPHIKTGEITKVPISCGISHVKLDKHLATQFLKVGKVFPKLFEFQNYHLKKDHKLKDIIKNSKESHLEFDLFSETDIYTSPSWVRVDFVVSHSNRKAYVIDINMLPGGIYFAHRLTELYISNFSVTDDDNYYNLENWFPEIIKDYNSISSSSINTHPFLNMEYENLANRFQFKHFQPSEINRTYDLLLRGFRLSHLSPIEYKILKKYISDGGKVLPGPCIWRENNYWHYYYLRKARELEAFLGKNNAAFFLDHLPNSSFIISEKGINYNQLPIQTNHPLRINKSMLKGLVLKSLDTAGGKGVIICQRNVGTKTLTKTLDIINNNREGRGFILQEFIRPEKITSHAFTNDGVFQKCQTPSRYTMFYNGEKMLGGLVTLSPSYKVQGGLNAVNLPVFW